jgi:hypothetical protein
MRLYLQVWQSPRSVREKVSTTRYIREMRECVTGYMCIMDMDMDIVERGREMSKNS